MGSKISKACVRRPHVNAAASVSIPVPSSDNHEQKTTPRQELRLPDIKSELPLVDDTYADVAASSIEHDSFALADDVDAMEIETRPRQSTDSRSGSLFRGLQELPGDVLDYDPPPPAIERPRKPPPPREPPPVICIICGDHFARAEEHTAIRPCSRCDSPYCKTCLKTMFVKACTDMSRMPPKCCSQVALHHVRPYLTQEELALFKAKYEEWSTPKPFYCPVARCSAFIPERLLPRKRTNQGKQRVDSGVGTPTSNVIACPSCETDICIDCRNLAHANSTCGPLDFGIDKETAELLKTWGYKRCPKCGNGLKRMFGCNHMECRCGAHFCWVCLKNQENGCDGGCYDAEEEDYSDGEPDRDDDEEQTESENTNNAELSTAEELAVAQTVEPTAVELITPPLVSQPAETQPTPRVLNLDGGSGRYWEEADYDFGGEPTDDIQDRAWDCYHDFTTAKVSLADSLRKAPSATGMECMKCWCAIHPEIQMPNSINNGGIRTVTSMASPRPTRGRGRGRRGTRLQPYPARNPFQTQPAALLGSSVPVSTSHSQPMEGIQYNPFAQPAPASSERVIDTYGNTITTTETPISPRRASLDVDMLDEDSLDEPMPEWLTNGPMAKTLPAPKHVHKPSRINLATSSSPFSFAYYCDDCGLFVCNSCKDNLLAAMKEEAENEQADGGAVAAT
jgi:hypothetical protein